MPIFEWNHAKARRNQAKHAVGFELAERVFADPYALMLQDRVEEGEERWQAIGRVGSYTILVVAHVIRMRDTEEIIRIISVRRALKHERRLYESQAY